MLGSDDAGAAVPPKGLGGSDAPEPLKYSVRAGPARTITATREVIDVSVSRKSYPQSRKFPYLVGSPEQIEFRRWVFTNDNMQTIRGYTKLFHYAGKNAQNGGARLTTLHRVKGDTFYAPQSLHDFPNPSLSTIDGRRGAFDRKSSKQASNFASKSVVSRNSMNPATAAACFATG